MSIAHRLRGGAIGMRVAAEPSGQRRRLGRSRAYTLADLPKRLLAWHAPRANRWEYLRVEEGVLQVEWLGARGVHAESLGAGETRWIEPGTRWRVAGLDEETRFLLEIHADESTPAAAPQALRAALLAEAPRRSVADDRALAAVLASLAPGGRCLIDAGFDPLPEMTRAREGRHGATLCWHPLQAGKDGWTVLVGRSVAPLGLAEYLAQDHAVIEAALALALRGRDGGGWLRFTLARHLAIEEEVLFPPWLAAGGNPGWARGLCNEHRHLRRDLGQLGDPGARRRFLLLLDGHDEKEEQVVYPDIVARLEASIPTLLREALLAAPRGAD